MNATSNNRDNPENPVNIINESAHFHFFADIMYK